MVSNNGNRTGKNVRNKQSNCHCKRAILISHLIDSLDELEEQGIERLWLEEASRRFQEFKDGNIQARSGSEICSDIRAKLQDM